MKTQVKKTVRAWAIVNTGFEKRALIHPNLYTGRLYLTKERADEYMESLCPKNCTVCGRKNKPRTLGLKILPCTITYSLSTKKQ